MFRRIKVRKHEQGFLFKDGVFLTILDTVNPGRMLEGPDWPSSMRIF